MNYTIDDVAKAIHLLGQNNNDQPLIEQSPRKLYRVANMGQMKFP